MTTVAAIGDLLKYLPLISKQSYGETIAEGVGGRAYTLSGVDTLLVESYKEDPIASVLRQFSGMFLETPDGYIRCGVLIYAPLTQVTRLFDEMFKDTALNRHCFYAYYVQFSRRYWCADGYRRILREHFNSSLPDDWEESTIMEYSPDDSESEDGSDEGKVTKDRKTMKDLD
jgi:hypothetical protein